MNSKKIILSIFIIFIVMLMATSVFAAYSTEKGNRPDYCNTEDMTDLHITSISAVKYTKEQNKDYCAVVTVGTNYYNYTDSKEWALGVIVVGDSADGFRTKYGTLMQKLYVDGSNNLKASGCFNISNYDSSFGNGILCSPTKANISTNAFSFKHGDKFCNATKFDVYVFKPWKVGFKFQNNAYICGVGTDKKDSRNLGASSSKLWSVKKSVFNQTYFYNIDYAYGVPVTSFKVQIDIKDTKEVNREVVQEDHEKPKENEKEKIESSTTTTLSYNLLPRISELKYKLEGASTEYSARKINNSDVFLVDYKDKDKNFNITLPSQFSQEELNVIVINSNNDNPDAINEIKNILNTGELKDYAETSLFDLSKSTASDIHKMSYILGSDKKFNFQASKNNNSSTTQFVFMQKSGNTLYVTSAALYILSHQEQSQYQLCEINKNILKFYCNGYNCNLSNISCLPSGLAPSGTTGTIDGLLDGLEEITSEPKEGEVSPSGADNGQCSIDNQKSVKDYIDCLINNLKVWDKAKTYAYSGSSGTGTVLMKQKYTNNNISACYNNKNFNETIFKKAKELSLSEEETAQFWSRIAAESGCNVSCGPGGCGSDGIAQINISAWNTQASYNTIATHLKNINPTKYSDFSTYQKNLISSTNNSSTSLDISAAIDRYNSARLIAKGGWTKDMETVYDHDDAIDMEFAKGYLYCATEYISYFSEGPNANKNINNGCAYTTFHKTGYYIGYKQAIYNCHNDPNYSNAFITAYKTNYGGKYCKTA